jgi:hypothetical protein
MEMSEPIPSKLYRIRAAGPAKLRFNFFIVRIGERPVYRADADCKGLTILCMSRIMRFIAEVSIRKCRRALAGRLVLRAACMRLDRAAVHPDMVDTALEVRSARTNLLEDDRHLETVEAGEERKKAEPLRITDAGTLRVPAVTSMRDAAHCVCLRTAVDMTVMMDGRHGWDG